MGTNLKRLMIAKMSCDAVPPGGGMADAVAFLTGCKIGEAARKAEAWSRAAVQAVREAAEPNPYRDWDDERIAGHLVAEIDKRRAKSSVPGA